jgi:hypothetical protein
MKLFESLKKGFLCEKGKISTEKKRENIFKKKFEKNYCKYLCYC